MRQWQEEQVQLLLSFSSEHEVFNELISLAEQLEFEYIAYGLRSPLPLTRPKIEMFNNYPAAWQARYKEKDYIKKDPTVHLGMRTLLPIIWSDDLFVGARDLWEDARSFGLQVGVAKSVRDAFGVSGMLTLARSGEPFSEEEIHQKRLKMLWLTQVAHLSMAQHLMAKVLPETEVKLSDREITVLRWTADGKTSGEISELLGIAERTVNFHINNAVAKLGTTNKLAAAIKATVLGMLY